ncbi:MAG: ubiquinone-dependent pyruvate dehydrogenase [Muribaculaceae bacterium]|nr:ubiquinone-dependent pyruvate dehydrogenase [Muribaculaceae bacterium]
MGNTDNTNRKRNVAEQVVDQLAESGVERIYGITGDSLNALTDAITRDGRIKFIHVRNEEAGAFAASAEAQLTGKLAVCAGSSGPGHVHLINGLYDAQRSNAPVLAIASTCASSLFGTGYFQETNPILLFSNCSVYNEMAVNPAQVPSMIHGAMQEAISRGGVGVVGLPADVINLEAASDGASILPSYTERLADPSDSELEKAAQLINDADTVAVFAGCGSIEAADLIKEFADLVKAPVATTYKSQMELTRDMPNYVGHMGYLGMWSAEDAIAEADLILVLGTNFPYPGFFPTDKKIIQVDIRAERLGKRAKLQLGVRADSKRFMEALLPRIEAKTDTSFLDKALAAWEKIQKKFALPVENPGNKGNIRPEFVISTLDKLADDNCVVTVDTGMNNVWTSHYLHPGRDRKMIGSFTHGSMANALPMAIGAKLACPDRQVISLSGDGGLAMLMGELLTIAQYKLPVKIFVADNRALAFVKWEMELAGYHPSEVDLANPDFAEVAKAIGIEARTVTDPADLEDAMKQWLQAEGPALLSVTTDTDAASFAFSESLMEKAAPGNPVSNFLAPGNV